MPVMSALERALCRSAPWGLFARRAVLPWALDRHPLGGDVLEIGAGSGAMAAAATHTFSDAHLTVTDLDRAMIDAARTQLAANPRVHVQVADVTALPFADGRFDMVACYLMLHHVIDWEEALVEVRRVLKPGGVFIGYDLTDTQLARWIHRVDGSPHRLIAPIELAAQLQVTGLREISVRESLRGHLMRFQARR